MPPAPSPSTAKAEPPVAASIPDASAVDAAAASSSDDAAVEVEETPIEELLFPGENTPEIASCKARRSLEARCLFGIRYRRDPQALALALGLFDRDGHVVSELPAQTFDGGYRGPIRAVPELPVGPLRHHLEWTDRAVRDFDAFFAALGARAGRPLAYRHTRLTFRFFRSVGKRTPAAFASGWRVAYNVAGTLMVSEDSVRETLFHEIFHLNDEHHGDFSTRVLAAAHARIRARCGTKSSCLAPFSPGSTVVRGGTYYAFQPGNDAREYGAELAIRYYREHRAIVRGEAPVRPPFKCGPAENAQVWRAIADEFFAGVDLTAPCR